MGQYYTAVVIDQNNRVTKLEPGKFNGFSKLTEHSWIGNEFVNTVYSLIHKHRRRVAWIGDYSVSPYDPSKDAYAKMLPYRDFKTIYDIAYGESPGLSNGLFFKREINILDYDTAGMFLINHDRSEFIDIAEYIHSSSVQDEDDKYPWCLSPLPLLTACGNGRGGGDFGDAYIGSENVGTWAFQWVEYTDKIPEGYAKANYRFIEKAVVSV